MWRILNIPTTTHSPNWSVQIWSKLKVAHYNFLSPFLQIIIYSAVFICTFLISHSQSTLVKCYTELKQLATKFKQTVLWVIIFHTLNNSDPFLKLLSIKWDSLRVLVFPSQSAEAKCEVVVITMSLRLRSRTSHDADSSRGWVWLLIWYIISGLQ